MLTTLCKGQCVFDKEACLATRPQGSPNLELFATGRERLESPSSSLSSLSINNMLMSSAIVGIHFHSMCISVFASSPLTQCYS